MTELKDDRRFHNLTQEQVETLDQVLTEVIPIHGRGNFPTLQIKPKDIICIVRDRLISKSIKVRDVRLNGSTASHVLVKENGTSYKDLDIIFGVELPKQEDFQIIKEVVLSCLLDFLPQGVNKDKITALTMKEAYVQKMVKVFTEHDRWSLISLSNNSGKNVELKFVSSLRRQFEFSVDSFQIILDPMLESYLEAERREAAQHNKKEQDAPLIQSADSQSGIINEHSTSTITDIHNKTTVDLPSESMDMPMLPDCVCNSEMVVIEDQCKPSTKETSPETTHNEDNAEFAQSITMSEAVEEISELSKTVTHEQNIDEVNKNGHVLKGERCSKGDYNDSQVENEQEAIVEGKNADESDTEPLASQDSVLMEGFTETENISAIVSVNNDPAPKMELEDMTCEPMQISEKTPEPMVLIEQCTFQPPNVTFLTQTAVDSYNEYPLPPPAKKNSRSSQMVVLKHSSPKPPRKMSRKVACTPNLAEKSKDSTNKPCQLLKHSVNGKDPKESMPMQTELPGLTTNCLESLSVVSHDKEPPFRILDKPSDVAQENGTHSEGGLPACLPTNKSVQTQVQISEPETGETTNCPIVGPLSKPFNGPMDESTKIQPLPEKVTKTYSQTVKPIIQVNSQPIIQVDDSPALTAISPVKEEAELAAQTAECTQEYSPETDTQTLESPSNSVASPSTNLTIDSEAEFAQALGLPVTLSQVPEPSISYVQPQEPTALRTQAQELPVVTSHLLESPVLLPHIQNNVLTDFPKPPEISPCLLEPTTSSTKQELSAWPSPVLEASTLSLEPSESSVESLHALEAPSVIAQPSVIAESSVQSPSRVVQSPIPPELECHLETSQRPNPSDSKESKEPLPPPRQVPSVTVVAESMYGDFEQAMDHLRYRLIATRNPEEIRGGGLLKYSNLLVRDFKPASETEIKTLERYMCSRFFIDFPDVNEQQRKIESYLRNHFIGEEKSKYDYLMTLRRVVNESTVCLMGHERRQTLNMITILALKVLGEQNIIPNTNNVTCYYQPAPYMADHNFSNYYIANGQSPLIYHPYPLHIHMQTGLV